MSDLSKDIQSLIQENALLRQRIQEIEISELQLGQTEKDLQETLQHHHFHTKITERQLTEKVLIESEKRFRLLAATSGRLLRAEEPQTIIQELCQDVMSHLDCQVFINFLADEQAGCLQLNAYAGIQENEAKAIEWLDFGVAICGCAAQTCRSIIIDDVLNSQDSRTDLIRSYGIQAYCCHPLMAEDHLIGTLSFGTKKRVHFTPDEVELMRIVADQVAVAMQRKYTERLLRQREFDLAEAQRVAALGSWGYDINTQAVNWSDELYRIFGIEKKALDGLYPSFLNLVHPEDKTKVLKTNREAIESGEPFEIEYRILTRNNQVRHIREVGYSRKDGSGKISGLFGTAQDITRQKQVELALRTSENQLRALTGDLAATIKAIPDLRFEVDLEGRIYDYSVPNHLNLYPPSESFLGKRVDEILPQEAAATILEAVADAAGKGWHFGAVYAAPMQCGLKWFELSIAAKSDPRASSARFIILARDVTERKTAEEVLKESEDKFRKLVDSTWEGIVVHKGGVILDINEPFLKMIGYDADDVIGKHVVDFLMPESIESALQKLKEGEGNPNAVYHQVKGLKNDQTMFYAEVLGRPFKYKNIEARVMAVRDITGHRQTEEALRQSEENFRNFLDHAPLGARIVTEAGDTIYANKALLDIYGYKTVEELQRTAARERYTPETYAEFVSRREKRHRGDSLPSQYEISVYRKNGEIRHLQVFRKEILWNNHFQFQVLYNDITERKKTEEELNNALLFNRHIIDSAQEGIIVYDRVLPARLRNGKYLSRLMLGAGK